MRGLFAKSVFYCSLLIYCYYIEESHFMCEGRFANTKRLVYVDYVLVYFYQMHSTYFTW